MSSTTQAVEVFVAVDEETDTAEVLARPRDAIQRLLEFDEIHGLAHDPLGMFFGVANGG